MTNITDKIKFFPFFNWYALQHYDRFNGEYAPFIIDVEHEEPKAYFNVR